VTLQHGIYQETHDKNGVVSTALVESYREGGVKMAVP
jgi:hypothetical protein